MVLVLPEHRRKGYASRLLHVALAEMEKQKRVALLDATPAGHEVYVQEGFPGLLGLQEVFPEFWNFRFKKRGNSQLESRDWETVLSLDAIAFGASREVVLRNLAARQPQRRWSRERNGRVRGIRARPRRPRSAAGRPAGGARRRNGAKPAGRGARAGPVRPSTSTSRITPRRCRPGHWRRDLRSSAPSRAWRTVRSGYAPGDAALVFCPAGPELG